MPKTIKLSLLFFIVALLFGCQKPKKETELTGDTQGTTYHIKLVLDGLPVTAQQAQTIISKTLADIDLKLSNYRDDSEIAHVNALETTDWQPVSAEIAQLVSIAYSVYQKSNGCYDLTIKPLFDLWGFTKHENRVPSPAEIAALLPHIGMSLLEVDTKNNRIRKKDPKLKIDLSSIAQGYSVEVLAKKMEALGIQNYMVEIGGEMMVKGRKADGGDWRVGIVAPTPLTMDVQKIIDIKQQAGSAVMTAGTYRNFFEEKGHSYSHILNPKTGSPVTHHLLSVTVMHESPTWADAWDTALLCVGEQEAARIAEAEKLKVLLVYNKAGKLTEYMSKAFTAAQ
jgi:thiamine biosynthesis lipoprotein